MTLAEWAQVELAITAAWPNARQMDEHQVRVRHRIAADLELDDALAAVIRLNRVGREFPPTPGQLADAVDAGRREQAPAPGTVIGLLRRAAGTFGREREADALRWLAMQVGGKHAARFAVEHGWRQFCMEGLDDPEFGGAVRQRIERSAAGSITGLEQEFREGRVNQLVGRRLQQLDAGTDARGLRRANPLEHLGLGGRPALEPGDDEDDDGAAGAAVPA